MLCIGLLIWYNVYLAPEAANSKYALYVRQWWHTLSHISVMASLKAQIAHIHRVKLCQFGGLHVCEYFTECGFLPTQSTRKMLKMFGLYGRILWTGGTNVGVELCVCICGSTERIWQNSCIHISFSTRFIWSHVWRDWTSTATLVLCLDWVAQYTHKCSTVPQ